MQMPRHRMVNSTHNLLAAEWYGIRRNDGRWRVARSLSEVYPRHLQRMYSKGRLLSSMSVLELSEIAYSIQIPDSTGRIVSDYVSYGNDDVQACTVYAKRVVCMWKKVLITNIWYRLSELEKIHHVE